jgi:hypothetical protein
MLSHIEAGPGYSLFSSGAQHPCERHDKPDFDYVLRRNLAGKERS